MRHYELIFLTILALSASPAVADKWQPIASAVDGSPIGCLHLGDGGEIDGMPPFFAPGIKDCDKTMREPNPNVCVGVQCFDRR